ncbi:MAG: transaldolase, partial [Blastocatellia bacterium]|nr:transaldolase [Blastocatellia bacterium]
PQTFEPFRDHGKVSLSLERNIHEAKSVLAELEKAGIDIRQVWQQLQDDGVKAFADSYESLLASIKSKQAALKSGTSR